jgi:hypothetical protein
MSKLISAVSFLVILYCSPASAYLDIRPGTYTICTSVGKVGKSMQSIFNLKSRSELKIKYTGAVANTLRKRNKTGPYSLRFVVKHHDRKSPLLNAKLLSFKDCPKKNAIYRVINNLETARF